MSKWYGGARSYGSYGASRQRRPFQSRSQFRRPMGAYIAPSRYVQAAQAPEQEVPYQPTHTFIDFGFDGQILANVQRHGYTTPTPIQDQAIPALMEGKDVVGIAQTGTGKTAAFLLPLLNKVLLDSNQGVLILAPTRELALQITEEFHAFAARLPVSSCLCIGGMNIERQILQLRN